MNIFLLSSLSNMIIDSASHWVGGRWSVERWSVVGGLVVRGFIKTQEKT